MQVIDFVIDAVVFAVGSLSAEGASFEAAVLDGVVVDFLGSPFEVVAEVVYLDIDLLEFCFAGWQEAGEVILLYSVALCQLANGDSGEIHVLEVVIGVVGFVAEAGGGIGDGVSVFRFIFAVEHKWDAHFGSEPRSEIFLSEDEGLERVEEVFDTESCEQFHDAAVAGERQIVEAPDVDPVLPVLVAVFGVEDRWPCDGQRMHAVFVFEDVSLVGTVFAAAAGYEAVIGAIFAAVAIQQLQQLFFAGIPVDGLFLFGDAAGIADPVGVDCEGFFAGIDGVSKFDSGCGPLVGHDAATAEADFRGQPVIGRKFLIHESVSEQNQLVELRPEAQCLRNLSPC